MKRKILNCFLMTAAILILAACSGVGNYNPQKCAALQEKIDNKQELSESEYGEMIDQLGGMINFMKEKEKEIGEDKEGGSKEFFTKSEEGKQLGKYFLYFGMYLDSHADQLSNSNKRKLNKIMTEYEENKKQ